MSFNIEVFKDLFNQMPSNIYQIFLKRKQKAKPKNKSKPNSQGIE